MIRAVFAVCVGLVLFSGNAWSASADNVPEMPEGYFSLTGAKFHVPTGADSHEVRRIARSCGDAKGAFCVVSRAAYEEGLADETLLAEEDLLQLLDVEANNESVKAFLEAHHIYVTGDWKKYQAKLINYVKLVCGLS